MSNCSLVIDNFVELNYCQSESALITDKEKIIALKLFIEEYFRCNLSYPFASKLFERLTDIAFCQRRKNWLTFRIIKEVNLCVSHYEYESLSQWTEYEKHLPNPFLTKNEADIFLVDYKVSIFKQMILQSAKGIHDIFYRIVETELEDLIPRNLVTKMGIDKLQSIEPFIQNIVDNQAKQTLSSKGFVTWIEWESKLREKALIDEVKGRFDICKEKV